VLLPLPTCTLLRVRHLPNTPTSKRSAPDIHHFPGLSGERVQIYKRPSHTKKHRLSLPAPFCLSRRLPTSSPLRALDHNGGGRVQWGGSQQPGQVWEDRCGGISRSRCRTRSHQLQLDTTTSRRSLNSSINRPPRRLLAALHTYRPGPLTSLPSTPHFWSCVISFPTLHP
jgi:hypothetical protein